MRTTSRLRRRVRLAFGSAILALLVVAAISYRAAKVSVESARWVQHTNIVLENLQALLLSIETIQSSARGFVLTGTDSYLSSYRAGVISAIQAPANIRDVTADNPVSSNGFPILKSTLPRRCSTPIWLSVCAEEVASKRPPMKFEAMPARE